MQQEKIFPFFWLRDGETNKIINEISKIKESGINAFCVESRVYEDFCGESWWKDMRLILEESRKRDMQVWLLDDKSYPTGRCNDKIKDKPFLRSKHIKLLECDVVGSIEKAKIPISCNKADEEQVIAVFAYKVSGKGLNFDSAVDLSKNVYGNFIYADIPNGQWRIAVIVSTFAGSERDYYIDPLNKDSVDFFISEVYESHYKKFSEYFGKTFVGFFSDEPRFANGASENYKNKSINDYENTLGIRGMAYPWSNECAKRFFAEHKLKEIIALWYDVGKETNAIRCDYMNIITDLYSENFSLRIGDWCTKHGVYYAGHIIEDMGVHTRLGCGAGHYFKSQSGMDFASIDIVLHQIKPYANEYAFPAFTASYYADPLFFNNTLVKLASSSANIDARKKGRSICEVFGAYGWGESVKDMKWLVNHCLVRGINNFIPHAFSLRDDDKDCPPHFYAQGKNPSFEAYKELWKYIQENCKRFNGGKRKVSVAVLYNAEYDWSGGKYFVMEKVLKELFQNQVDFDIFPENALTDMFIENGIARIGNAEYRAIIVPNYLFTSKITNKSLKILESKLKIYYLKNIGVKNIVQALYSDGICKSVVKTKAKNLRYMHYLKDGRDIYMFFNEGKRVLKRELIDGGKIELQAGEAVVCDDLKNIKTRKSLIGNIQGIKISDFDVFISETKAGEYRFYKHICGDFDINAYSELPNFSGFVKYAANVNLKAKKKLYVSYSGEGCYVKIGEKEYKTIDGEIICDLNGEKDYYNIEITINNVLAYARQDYFSRYNYIEGCYLKSVVLV